MSGRFDYGLIPPGSRVLCALSGGADSMYLLCRLLEGAGRGGYTVAAAHYNHNLRPTAARDECFVRDWCRRQEVELVVGSGDVAGTARRQGLGIEVCARGLRYDFLERAAHRLGCQLIATGHHAGDNAETVLMHLLRGSGLEGLCGIPPRRGRLIRPMLTLERGQVLAYLEGERVPHVEDESNDDPAYTRNRIRAQVLPLLEQLRPGATERIAAAAARLRVDRDALEADSARLATQARPTPRGLSLPARVLAAAPRATALRAAGTLLARAGLGDRSSWREGIVALAVGDRPSGGLDVAGGRVYRAYGELIFSPGRPEPPPPEQPLEEGETRWGAWVIAARTGLCPPAAYAGPGEFYLKPAGYVIRSRKPGDGLRLGKRPWKSLKKLMIEERVPREERPAVPVLALEGGAAAVGGLGPDWDALAAPGKRCLHITMRRGE